MNKMFSKMVALVMLGSILLMTGCVGMPYQQNAYQQAPVQQSAMFYGNVIELQTVANTRQNTGGGAILGGVVGGLLGHQVGKGNGRTFTTVGGAVAGALVGNTIENKNSVRMNTDVVIRLDCGYILNLPQRNGQQLWTGDRVQVFVNGGNVSVSRLNQHAPVNPRYVQQAYYNQPNGTYQNQQRYQQQQNEQRYQQQQYQNEQAQNSYQNQQYQNQYQTQQQYQEQGNYPNQ